MLWRPLFKPPPFETWRFPWQKEVTVFCQCVLAGVHNFPYIPRRNAPVPFSVLCRTQQRQINPGLDDPGNVGNPKNQRSGTAVPLRKSTFSVLVFLLLAAPASAESPTLSLFLPTRPVRTGALGVLCTGLDLNEPVRARVGLALSGGGVRGIAQIGVLQVLHGHRIPVDVVVGTSMGSVIGGLYAAGLDPDEIWEFAKNIRWQDILIDRPPRSHLFLGQKRERERYLIQLRLQGSSLRPDIPLAFTPGQRLTSTLTAAVLSSPFGYQTRFDCLPIRYRALATDLIHGQPVLLRGGNLVEVMRASVSIPLLFTPVQRGDTLLVDGGLVSNIPVAQTYRAGADLVIAVDTTSPLRKQEEINLPWEVADQVTTIMQRERNRQELAQADVAIRVPFPDLTALDFKNIQEIYTAGKRKAELALPSIKSCLASCTDSLLSATYGLPLDTRFRVQVARLPSSVRCPDSLDTTGFISLRDLHRLMLRAYANGLRHVRASLVGDTLVVDGTPAPKLDSIHVQHTGLLAASELDSVLAGFRGRALDATSLVALVSAIHRQYRRHGWALAHVDSVGFDSARGLLTLKINDGRIDRITVDGNTHTRTYVILREFPLSAGQPFNLPKAERGLDQIYSTGLFEWVGLAVRQSASHQEIVIRVKERDSRLVRFGARYDLERRGKLFVEYADENLLGAGNTLSALGLYGVRDQEARIDYRVDRIFRTFLTTQFDLYHRSGRHFAFRSGRSVGEYREKRTGFTFRFGEQMHRLGTVWFGFRWENILLRRLSGEGYPTGSYTLRTIGIRSLLDSRDRIPFARSGKRHELFYEYSSGRFLTSQISYTKFASSLESFFTFAVRHTLHAKIDWGISDLTTPFPEQYTLGGQNSFYGLREEELRGRHFWLSSLEYRYALPWGFHADWYLSFRLDWGAIWPKDIISISNKDFFYGVGAALSADTILGPFTIAYGRTQHGETQLYFSAGKSF